MSKFAKTIAFVSTLITTHVHAAHEITENCALMQTHDVNVASDMNVSNLQLDQQFAKLTGGLHDTLVGVVQDPDAMKKLPKGWLDTIRAQMKQLRDAIQQENVQDQKNINLTAVAVAQCNVNKDKEFVDVNKLKQDVSSGREEHVACRKQEIVKVDDKHGKCAKSQHLTDATCVAKPSCICSKSGCDTKSVLACQAELASWLEEHQQNLLAANKICNEQTSGLNDQHTLCDKLQTKFEAFHCQLSGKLLPTCLEFDNCYNNTKTTHDALENALKSKELSQKQMSRAEQKISCYLNVFAKAEKSVLVEADIKNCTTDLQVNTEHLNIIYPGLPSKASCDVSLAAWNPAEYDDLNATFVKSPSQCCIDSITVPKCAGQEKIRGAKVKLQCRAGYIVFQQRISNTVDFHKSWVEYKKGFGDTDNFWLGNENLHKLTKAGAKLRVEITSKNGAEGWAEWDKFVISTEDLGYALTLGGFTGNITGGDRLNYHSGQRFSTKDRDNSGQRRRRRGTRRRSEPSCAEKYKGGWWYNSCFHCNLNGAWGGGMVWSRRRSHMPATVSRMMVKPA